MILVIDRTGEFITLVVKSHNLDASNYKRFCNMVDLLLDRYKEISCDLSHIKFMDSVGIGGIINCLKRAQEVGGNINIVGLSDAILALFELVKLHSMFEAMPDKEVLLQDYCNETCRL